MKRNKDTMIGFTVSVVLHGALLAAVLFSATQEKIQTATAPKSVSISLSSLSEVVQETPTKKVCDKPKKKVKKHKEHKKLAHKPKPAPKKVLEKAAIPVEKEIVKKEEVLKEEIKEVQEVQKLAEAEPIEELEKIDEQEEKILAAKELQKKEQEAQELAQSLHEQFIQTNFDTIRQMVLSHLSYPLIAKRMGYEGVVHIMLVIDTTGKLLDVMVEKSSGHAILDKSALKAASRLASEILPNPQNISKVSLPVYFALK